MLVLDRALGVALGISGDVSQVTNVAVLIGGSTVGLVVGVDWKPGSQQGRTTCGEPSSGVAARRSGNPEQKSGLTVRTGRGATVGIVTKGVDVHAALRTSIVASDVPGDSGGIRLGGLLEGDSAGDLGVTTDDAN